MLRDIKSKDIGKKREEKVGKKKLFGTDNLDVNLLDTIGGEINNIKK